MFPIKFDHNLEKYFKKSWNIHPIFNQVTFVRYVGLGGKDIPKPRTEVLNWSTQMFVTMSEHALGTVRSL